MATKLQGLGSPLAYVRNRRFLHHIAVLGSGTAIAQIANVAATPILATLYDPKSFGVMAIYMGIVLVVGTMASFTYDSAIILPKSDSEALTVFVLCIYFISMISIISLLLLLAIFYLFSSGELVFHWALIFLIPLGIFSLGSLNAGSHWSVRHEQYKSVSKASIIRSLGAVIAQITSGLLGANALGLIFGRIFGQCAASFYLLRSSSLNASQLLSRSFSALIRSATSHYRFPLFKAPQNVIVLLSDQMPAFALATAFGASSAGLYWMADRILNLPSTVVSEATAKAFYRESVKSFQKNETMRPLFYKTVAGLFIFALFPSMIIFFYAPVIFGVLGDDWQSAGHFAKWMMIWALFRFSCAPVMAIYMITDQQHRLLKIDTVSFVVRMLLFGLAFNLENAVDFVMIVCLFESIKITYTTFDIALSLRKLEQEV